MLAGIKPKVNYYFAVSSKYQVFLCKNKINYVFFPIFMV
jgi:hypothetical protein